MPKTAFAVYAASCVTSPKVGSAMSALILITGTAALTLGVVVPVVALLLLLIVAVATMSPEQRLMRKRRRHAERTARAMRRMTEIRHKTIERMDRTEGRRRL